MLIRASVYYVCALTLCPPLPDAMCLLSLLRVAEYSVNMLFIGTLAISETLTTPSFRKASFQASTRAGVIPGTIEAA